MKFYLLGKHSHRTPLSYDDLSYVRTEFFQQVEDIFKADLVILGFQIDLTQNKGILFEYKRRRSDGLILVLSEEPLWDLIWSEGRKNIRHTFAIEGEVLDYFYLNHYNSNLYKTSNYPYFLLTSNEYLTRYNLYFAENLKLSKTEVLKIWNSPNKKVKFLMEKRVDSRYTVFDEKKILIGLSEYRTQIAMALGSDLASTNGLGWGAKKRQELADWHFEKLLELKNISFLISAIENTNCACYITEKIFDAYAACGYPITYLSDENLKLLPFINGNHLNLYGCDVPVASKYISEFNIGMVDIESYLETQSQLRALFSNNEKISVERYNIYNRLQLLISNFYKES